MPSKSGEFGQVSFVNSICTYRGGTHVKYIRDQLVAGIHKYLARRHKKDAPNVTDTMIRNNLHVSHILQCEMMHVLNSRMNCISDRCRSLPFLAWDRSS